MSAKIVRPIAFEWRIQSPQGKFTGQQKAELVDRMEQIAARLAQGSAKVEFSFDIGAVIAKISPKVSPEMIERAQERALRASTRGLHGLIAKALLFWHGLGPDAKKELERMLAQDYLRDEQAKAAQELLGSFKHIMAHAEALGSIDGEPAKAPAENAHH